MNVSVHHLRRLAVTRLCHSCVRHLATGRTHPSVPSGGKHLSTKTKTENSIDFDHKLCDTFGTLGTNDYRLKRLAAEELPDDDDHYDVLEIKRGPKCSEEGYKRQIRSCIYRRTKRPVDLAKALELYNRMISEDRIRPDKPTYTLLITGCAKVGYTEKAFELFEEQLKNGFRPSRQCITSLFNACAESPFKELGLEKAEYLRQWMELQGFEPNIFNYHSMIKAFGKLGQLQTAFRLVEEMSKKGHVFDDYTLAMLMMACISNRESGLFSAIRVFRRFASKGMPISINVFNLLLRTVRDCGIGSEDNLNLLIESSCNPLRNPSANAKLMDKPSHNLSSTSNSLVPAIPNLLVNQSLSRAVIKVDFDLLSRPHNRLMLLGGIEGFVKMMIDFKVRPNIKSLTLMTDIIDFNEVSEKLLLVILDKLKIKADTDFFNILIKRICHQKGLLFGKQLFQEMTSRGLEPNIMTFGVLALGCSRREFGKQLLEDMEGLNILPNIEIMGALMTNAVRKENIIYINYLIEYMRDNQMSPDQRMAEQLEAIKVKFQKIIIDFERNQCNKILNKFKSEKFRENFAHFKRIYGQWIESCVIGEADHPWHQFQFDELPNKRQMHSFVKFMKSKIRKRRGIDEKIVDEYEEDELYND